MESIKQQPFIKYILKFWRERGVEVFATLEKSRKDGNISDRWHINFCDLDYYFSKKRKIFSKIIAAKFKNIRVVESSRRFNESLYHNNIVLRQIVEQL